MEPAARLPKASVALSVAPLLVSVPEPAAFPKTMVGFLTLNVPAEVEPTVIEVDALSSVVVPALVSNNDKVPALVAIVPLFILVVGLWIVVKPAAVLPIVILPVPVLPVPILTAWVPAEARAAPMLMVLVPVLLYWPTVIVPVCPEPPMANVPVVVEAPRVYVEPEAPSRL